MEALMKIKVIFAVVVCAIILFVVHIWPVPPPCNMSPEETVTYHFQQINNRSKKAMNSVVYSKMRSQSLSFWGLNDVKLLSCEEADSSKINFQESWFSNPYAISAVNVEFDINYKEDYGSGIANMTYHWQYYLVKRDKTSEWMIVQWGMG